MKGLRAMATPDVVPAAGFVRPPADQQVHELIPGRALTIAATGQDTGNTFGMFDEVVGPGDGPPLHVHHDADEIFYVLAGEFTWLIGDLRARGGVGTVAFVPKGTVHTWQNSGSEEGRLLFVFSPAGFERFLLELCEVPLDQRTMESANRMGAACQTSYVGPPLAALP